MAFLNHPLFRQNPHDSGVVVSLKGNLEIECLILFKLWADLLSDLSIAEEQRMEKPNCCHPQGQH